MNYLHSLRPPVIHSDLKIENVLISDKLEAKASDNYIVTACYVVRVCRILSEVIISNLHCI